MIPGFESYVICVREKICRCPGLIRKDIWDHKKIGDVSQLLSMESDFFKSLAHDNKDLNVMEIAEILLKEKMKKSYVLQSIE